MEKENELLQVKHLLEQTEIIDKKHKEIARITGANYNIFDVMNISKKEVFHSRFIANLLNPNGSHSQGVLFLNLFLKEIMILVGKNSISDKNTDIFKCFNENLLQVDVKTEKYFGKINSEYTEGGFADIFLEVKGCQIIIENKIGAQLQKNQLLRYVNFTANSIVLYLDLDGDKVFNNLQLDLNKDFFYITYKDEILNWLKLSQKKICQAPILRETFSQYLSIINKLTKKNNNKMNEELALLLFNNKKMTDLIYKTRVSKEYLKLFDTNYGIPIYNIFKCLLVNKNLEMSKIENLKVYNENKANNLLNYKCDMLKYFYPSFKFNCDKGFNKFNYSIRANTKEIENKFGGLILDKVLSENLHPKTDLIIFSNGLSEFTTWKDWQKCNESDFELKFINKFNNKLQELIEIIINVEKDIIKQIV